MMPIPPSSAITIAIGARVTVSMFAETTGRLTDSFVVSRDAQIDRAGSRLDTR